MLHKIILLFQKVRDWVVSKIAFPLQPGVSEGFLRTPPLVGVDLEAVEEEVSKEFVLQLVFERLRESFNSLNSGFFRNDDVAVFVKKLSSLLCLLNHLSVRIPYLNVYQLNQLVLVNSWEEGSACEQLRGNAAKTPHVSSLAVGESKDDLRRSVIPALNVGEPVSVVEAAGPKVNNLHTISQIYNLLSHSGFCDQ